MEQQLFRKSVQLRMGIDEEPGWCEPVDAEEWCRRRLGSGCARSLQASRTFDADDGPRFADGPCLRKDLEALLRKSGSVRRCLCQGMVQANPPRHGADFALPWPAGSKGAPDLARPGSRCGS